jgi:putative copper resistance protein D
VRLVQLLTAWPHDWPVLIVASLVLVTVAWYLVAVRRLSRRGRRWAGRRTMSFMFGMATIVVAVESGLASYDDRNFTAHIAQHLLLMNLAPPLLAMGAPITLALQASQRGLTTFILKVLHSSPARLAIHPVFAGVMAMTTMYLYFLTPIYRLSIEHVWFHYYTHAHFLIVGCLYWWPIVGRDVLPRRWSPGTKLIILFAAVPWSTYLGLYITQMSYPIAPQHTLSDTHAGGFLLWAASEAFTLFFLVVVFRDWARADQRRADRAERLTLASVEPVGPSPPPPPAELAKRGRGAKSFHADAG